MFKNEIDPTPHVKNASIIQRKIATIITAIIIIPVVLIVSCRVGQTTFLSSILVSFKK
jgi:hypothetical protein